MRLRSVPARLAFALFFCCAPALAWTESVEFPWNAYPRHLWERELVWLKNIGIRHISLPPSSEPGQMTEVIAVVRRVGLQTDLEQPIPASLEALSVRHGGPLTDPIPNAVKLSVSQADALARSRELLLSGAPGLIWTGVEDTLGPAGYAPGAVTFAGQERPGAATLRRAAHLSSYWSASVADLHELEGAGTRVPAEAIVVKQFVAGSGASLVSVRNTSSKPWTGDVRATYPALHRIMVLPNVTVSANDVAWLPIGLPLTNSPVCHECGGFAPTDHLVYATSEITAMEYENGILALEFASPGMGEVVLQLSREPNGPLVAGGKPTALDWDEHTLRARLPIPATPGATHHVRIGLAMQAPDSTAFFDSARVLLIGETNRLKAQFSSEAVAQRSRLVAPPDLATAQKPGANPLEVIYEVKVPASAVHGDHADLTLEADGSRMSHARPQILLPVTARFPDAVSVHVGGNSSLLLDPFVIPVNQRSGRDFGVVVRNNAAEIRTFRIAVSAEGLEFSPPQSVTIGASDAREVTFRVFPGAAAIGLHSGELKISGAAVTSEALRLLILPSEGSVAWDSDPFHFKETSKVRESYLGEKHLESLNKDTGQDVLPEAPPSAPE